MVVHVQGHGHDVRAVQGAVDDAAANGIAVQADEQVEQGGPVADHDLLGALQGAQDLLGEVEGVVLPLLIGQPGVGGQVVQGDGRATGQGICFADEHVGAEPV